MDLSKHVNYHRICPYNETYGLFVGLLTIVLDGKGKEFTIACTCFSWDWSFSVFVIFEFIFITCQILITHDRY